MTTTTAPTNGRPTNGTLVVPELVFADAERIAHAGFLAGYRGLTGRRTRWTYASSSLGANAISASCSPCTAPTSSSMPGHSRKPEERGPPWPGGFAPSPVSTAMQKRRAWCLRLRQSMSAGPRLDYESHAVGLDRNEIGALLVAAGLGAAAEHAFISLLALNGLRVSEAIGGDIEALGLEPRPPDADGDAQKEARLMTVPLAPRTARAVDLAIGERLSGPIFIGPDGRRFDRHTAGRIVPNRV